MIISHFIFFEKICVRKILTTLIIVQKTLYYKCVELGVTFNLLMLFSVCHVNQFNNLACILPISTNSKHNILLALASKANKSTRTHDKKQQHNNHHDITNTLIK
jgi:hypothetical protein